MAETEAFLATRDGFHSYEVNEIYNRFSSSSHGLTMEAAKETRVQYGLNRIQPPFAYPSWLCCLLPCLKNTQAMLIYQDIIPKYTMTKRDRRWIQMDSTGLVVGDIIRIETDDRIPADTRIIEEYERCTFDTSYVLGRGSQLCADSGICTPFVEYLSAANMAFTGYICRSGSCLGIVVATGKDTILSKLIQSKSWPPSLT